MEHTIGARKEDLVKIAEKVSCINAKELFFKTKLDLFTKNNEIIHVNEDDALEDAIATLVDNKTLSVPVFQKRKKTYVKFLDVLDIVDFLTKSMKKFDVKKAATLKFEEMMDVEAFKKAKVKDAAETNNRANFYPVPLSSPIFAVLENILNHDLHRVPVIDAEGNVADIVSQSDLVKYVLVNKKFFVDLLDKKVKDLFPKKDVFSVKNSDTLASAFSLINSKNVSGVAVVDNAGKLVGNVSGSDVKVLDFKQKKFNKLFATVEEALKENKHYGSPVCVDDDKKLGEVLDTLVESHIHRVFIVDQQKKPVGTICLYDVLKVVKDVIDK